MPRLFFLLCLSFILGCSGDEPIRTYTAPKAVEPTYRILGAIYPQDNPAWFFKLAGRADLLEKHAADVDRFLASVRFINGPQNLPTWTLPQGWRDAKGESEFVAATLLLGSEDAPLKLTVSKAMGGLEPNLQRWAGQLGLTWQPGDKDKYARPLDQNAGWKIDMTGPQNPAARGMMPGR